MSIDPLAEKYAYNSTYAFQENKMGMGRELEGLELAPSNPTASFGGWFSSKYDSAVSSIQTNTAKVVQAVSNAISSLEIKPVDGVSIGYVSSGKNGISGTPGLFNPAPSAKASLNVDGNFLQGLAAAYAPNLGDSKLMNGANIFSNLAQDPLVNKAIGSVTDGSSVTALTNNPDNESTVTAQRINYSSTDVLRGNASQVHTPNPKDTAVQRKDAHLVPMMNTRDSIRAVKETEAKNKLPIKY